MTSPLFWNLNENLNFYGYTAEYINSNAKAIYISVADPGFPIGGAPTHWGGADLRHVHFLAKTYVKMKEMDPVGGGAHAGGTPLNLPMYIYIWLGIQRCDGPERHEMLTVINAYYGYYGILQIHWILH